MKQILEHQFKTKAHSLINLFEGVTKMSTFMRRLERESQIDPLRYDSDKYKGDAFEFFVELFLMLHPTDNRIGVTDYTPVQVNDNGVDGIGINMQGHKCVIQIKYRGNTQGLLTANQDHLSNMFSDGMLAHGVVASSGTATDEYKHFVFTTAKSLHFYTDQEMFKSKVKCIGYDHFRQLLDNNIPFWDKVIAIVKEIEEENNSPS